MHRAYHRWWSPSLQRDMELLEFGHAGAKVIGFPTSRSRFFEWEERGMIGALRYHLERGHFHLFCVDTVDHESWYARWKHPGARVWRQVEYDGYVVNEVLPFVHWRNPHPFVIAVGASFGAFHALSIGLRHPEKIHRVLSLSGLCNIRGFLDGYSDDNVYFLNPPDFLPNEHDGHRLYHLRRQDVILAVGNGDQLVHQNRDLSGKLWAKGIGNALREWDGFAHDWPVWHRQVNLYLGGHD